MLPENKHESGLSCGSRQIEKISAKLVNSIKKKRFDIEDNTYHVTEIVSCLRRSYHKRKNSYSEDDYYIWRKFCGSSLHRALTYATSSWRELQVKMKIRIDSEIVFLIGYVDNYDPELGKIYDHKTTRFLNWQQKNGIIPRESDILQIRIYGTILKNVYGIPVNNLILLYCDDSNWPIPYEVPLEDLTDWITERVKLLHNSLKNEKPPPLEETWLCSKCEFKDCKSHLR